MSMSAPQPQFSGDLTVPQEAATARVAPTDDELARKYGPYAGFRQAESAPIREEYHGEDPEEELQRLLDRYAHSMSHVLDIGCGAGQTLCRLAPRVKEMWGFDQEPELLAAADRRARSQQARNVRLVEGNVAAEGEVARLPRSHFDLAFSQRGPNMNAALVRTLREGAFFVQLLVGSLSAYPLREILGREGYAGYNINSHDPLLSDYASLHLRVVSVKEYYYDQYFRDADHLEMFVRQTPVLNTWRSPWQPYEAERDRPALQLYVRYNTTDQGVRVLGHRKIFTLYCPHGSTRD
jgi:SAM-dependent methyltransferase